VALGTHGLSITIMDADIERRFGGLARLYGVQGAAAIRAAHVAVVGIGGVGSWAAEALARSGVGRITLIDFDNVAESNINRQVHADTNTVGMAKVDAMRARIAQINPHCQVTCIEEFATPENWLKLVGAMTAQDGLSAVIDACDQVKTKVTMAAWALAQRKSAHASLFITAGAAGGKRRADKIDIADLAGTTHDPLLAKLRYSLRRHHGAARDKTIGTTCVFSREAVAQPDATVSAHAQSGLQLNAHVDTREDGQSDGSLNCHGYGSVVTVTASFGLCAAGWVLDQIAKK
jgi:tRNA threonylcarbamoyladenosine dehydratase